MRIISILILVGGLPFFQFYPSDYLRDTRALSCATKGGWVDILCMLHGSSTRGAMTLPFVGWARVIGATVDQTEAIISELETMRVADVTRVGNGDVTIRSRRMLRDAITREQTRLRVERHRRNTGRNGAGNGDVTPKKPETRNHNTEESLRSSRSEPVAPPPTAASGELPLGTIETNPNTDPVLLTFPTVGTMSEWPLRESKIAEWRAAYPAVKVDDALRELRQWCIDNPRKRKTARGMNAFLSGRLAWRQDRGGGSGMSGGRKAGFA